MVDAKAKPFSDEKRWIVIYPTYLDSKKSLQQGRKIPKELAVENPTAAEIMDVLTATGLNPVLERGKLHPREQDREPEKLGRVRVMLKNDDGTPKNSEYPTSEFIICPNLETKQDNYTKALEYQQHKG
ncbi:unnamed protein product [Heligmosomoides polygyrus]|uniref:Signal recognition particle 19 kDa protein n=1 Tax=Heligmosomoides polygyrus TaxID=6339 RepID=A0A183GFX9_HELPZ|nr:unnamed protein product [Heligmosomoides polygyrus]